MTARQEVLAVRQWPWGLLQIMMNALGGRKKCSTKIIPPLFDQRQGNGQSLCDYREVCAIKLVAIEFARVGGAEGGL